MPRSITGAEQQKLQRHARRLKDAHARVDQLRLAREAYIVTLLDSGARGTDVAAILCTSPKAVHAQRSPTRALADKRGAARTKSTA